MGQREYFFSYYFHVYFLQKAKKKGKKKTYKLVANVVEPELVVEMGANYPSALNRLWTWAKGALLADGRTVSF